MNKIPNENVNSFDCMSTSIINNEIETLIIAQGVHYTEKIVNLNYSFTEEDTFYMSIAAAHSLSTP